MRKRTKTKERSCALCKPHKMGFANRWKIKDEDSLVRFEKDKQDLLGKVDKEGE